MLQDKWLEPWELMLRVEHLVKEAQTLVEEHWAGEDNAGDEEGTAAAVVQALLAGLLFGYSFPLRVSCLAGLLQPHPPSLEGLCKRQLGPVLHAKAVCPNPDCLRKHMDCLGNRLKWVEGQGGGQQELWIVLPHHKNQRRGQGPIITQLHSALAGLMEWHIEVGQGMLLAEGGSSPFVFFSPESGAALTPEQLTRQFQMAVGHQVSPQMCRSIFVTGRYDQAALPGLGDEAAAQAMGNTLKQWEDSYNKQQGPLGGVKELEAYTASMLKQARQQQQQAVAAPAASAGQPQTQTQPTPGPNHIPSTSTSTGTSPRSSSTPSPSPSPRAHKVARWGVAEFRAFFGKHK